MSPSATLTLAGWWNYTFAPSADVQLADLSGGRAGPFGPNLTIDIMNLDTAQPTIGRLPGSGMTAWLKWLTTSRMWLSTATRDVTVDGIRGVQLQISKDVGEAELLTLGRYNMNILGGHAYQMTLLPVHGHIVMIAVSAPTTQLRAFLQKKVAPVIAHLVFR